MRLIAETRPYLYENVRSCSVATDLMEGKWRGGGQRHVEDLGTQGGSAMELIELSTLFSFSFPPGESRCSSLGNMFILQQISQSMRASLAEYRSQNKRQLYFLDSLFVHRKGHLAIRRRRSDSS